MKQFIARTRIFNEQILHRCDNVRVKGVGLKQVSSASLISQAVLQNMIEARRHPRVKASIPIDWGLTTECARSDRITSFSIGGCFLQTVETVDAWSIIFIRFYLSTTGERIIKGEVKYHLENVGLGVEFIELTDEDKRNFQILVDYYHQP
jgi:hypothetical protein